jgi:hypothetical protein
MRFHANAARTPFSRNADGCKGATFSRQTIWFPLFDADSIHRFVAGPGPNRSRVEAATETA